MGGPPAPLTISYDYVDSTFFASSLPAPPPLPANDVCLSREPFDPETADELPAPSRFVSAAMAVVAAMPIERKAALLVGCIRKDDPKAPPASKWKLRVALMGDTSPAEPFARAVEAAIYFELKSELGVGLERLPSTTRFVKWRERRGTHGWPDWSSWRCRHSRPPPRSPPPEWI